MSTAVLVPWQHAITSSFGTTSCLFSQPFFCAAPPAKQEVVVAQAGAPEDIEALHNLTLAIKAGASKVAAAAVAAAAARGTQPNVTAAEEMAAQASMSEGGGSVNIVTTTIRPHNITVLEDEEAVWVDAGVITWDLIRYLGAYVTAKAPAGWTLVSTQHCPVFRYIHVTEVHGMYVGCLLAWCWPFVVMLRAVSFASVGTHLLCSLLQAWSINEC